MSAACMGDVVDLADKEIGSIYIHVLLAKIAVKWTMQLGSNPADLHILLYTISASLVPQVNLFPASIMLHFLNINSVSCKLELMNYEIQWIHT